MNPKLLIILCYWICLASVVAATVIAFSLIWVTQENQYLWKSLLSAIVVLFASGFTLSVCKTFISKPRVNKENSDRTNDL